MDLPMLTEMLMEFFNNDDDDENSVNVVHISRFENDISPLVTAVAATLNTSPCEILRGCVQGFFSTVIPTYSPDTFKSHFRMTRSTF